MQTVIRIRPPRLDEFGDPVAGAPVEVSLPGASVATTGVRQLDDHDTRTIREVSIDWEADVDIVDTDKLRLPGSDDVYTVVGVIKDQWRWGGGCSGTTVRAQVVT